MVQFVSEGRARPTLDTTDFGHDRLWPQTSKTKGWQEQRKNSPEGRVLEFLGPKPEKVGPGMVGGEGLEWEGGGGGEGQSAHR